MSDHGRVKFVRPHSDAESARSFHVRNTWPRDRKREKTILSRRLDANDRLRRFAVTVYLYLAGILMVDPISASLLPPSSRLAVSSRRLVILAALPCNNSTNQSYCVEKKLCLYIR